VNQQIYRDTANEIWANCAILRNESSAKEPVKRPKGWRCFEYCDTVVEDGDWITNYKAEDDVVSAVFMNCRCPCSNLIIMFSSWTRHIKQNKYEMPLLDIVGVTSLGKELLCRVLFCLEGKRRAFRLCTAVFARGIQLTKSQFDVAGFLFLGWYGLPLLEI
jgi:hypothetical protein